MQISNNKIYKESDRTVFKLYNIKYKKSGKHVIVYYNLKRKKAYKTRVRFRMGLFYKNKIYTKYSKFLVRGKTTTSGYFKIKGTVKDVKKYSIIILIGNNKQ